MDNKRWHIFCKVVDNFGDIGVSWRLARQLAHEYDLQIRLFVDDLAVAGAMIPGLQPGLPEQVYENITIVHWQATTQYETQADVVIETFACGLPEAYLAKMQAGICWINLDYLSAEPWVADFHGHNSNFYDQKLRHFYFPGFTPDSGGLIRERDLIAERDLFLSAEDRQRAFWQQLNVEPDGLLISLFFYPNAPLSALFDTLINGSQTVTVLAPHNPFLQSCADFFGRTRLNIGDTLQLGKLKLQVLPFLSQAEFDQLLWACDINFVRGEDSWLRAIWAAKPFIWQPYRQTENTHLVKLKAFINTFFARPDSVSHMISRLHLDWSVGEFSPEVWQHYLHDLTFVRAHTQHACKRLTLQQDLASKLLGFVKTKRFSV